MSLIEQEEYINEIQTKKGRKSSKLTNFFSKTKFVLIILIIGMILGIIFGQYFINPLIEETTPNTLKNCIAIKEILSTENYCLYSAIENPQEVIEQCKQK